MTVRKFLQMLGKNMSYHFIIHWNYDEKDEKIVETSDIKAVEELFGNWNLAEEDSIHFSSENNTEKQLELYVHKISFIDEYIDENPIECPCCGAEHERETPDEVEHCCFYCGYSWKDEEEKGKNESE